MPARQAPSGSLCIEALFSGIDVPSQEKHHERKGNAFSFYIDENSLGRRCFSV